MDSLKDLLMMEFLLYFLHRAVKQDLDQLRSFDQSSLFQLGYLHKIQEKPKILFAPFSFSFSLLFSFILPSHLLHQVSRRDQLSFYLSLYQSLYLFSGFS
jgi:hypothetical protein